MSFEPVGPLRRDILDDGSEGGLYDNRDRLILRPPGSANAPAITVDAITAVNATSLGLVDGDVLIARGLNSASDLLGGEYIYDADSIAPSNPPNVVVPAVGAGRFLAVKNAALAAAGGAALWGTQKTGGVVRTGAQKMEEVRALADWATVQDAIDNNVSGSRLFVPAGDRSGYSYTNGSSKRFFWQADGATVSGVVPFYGPGIVAGMFQKRYLMRSIFTAPDDVAVLNVQRVTSHTGGTSGNANAAILGEIIQDTAVSDSNWAVIGKTTVNANGGEPVGVYGQCTRNTGGQLTPIFGVLAEARDETGLANPTLGTVGCETDVWANGTDNNNVRVGHNIVIGRPSGANASGVKNQTCYGSWITAKFNDPAEGKVKFGYAVALEVDNACFDATAATLGASAAVVRRATSQYDHYTVVNNGAGTRRLGYDAFGFRYLIGTPGAETAYVNFKDTGSIDIGGAGYEIFGTKIIGARGAAVANASGGATIDSEARAAINALLARLRTHGLIAT